jgi:hypothetical protein
MKRINLQMFADPNSIVDYLKSTGADSSYSARKELAASLGISNYSGTASQNTQMLNALKNSSASSSTSGSSGSSSSPRPQGAPADAPSYTETGKEANYYTKENPYVVPSGTSSSKKNTSTKDTPTFTQSSASKNANKTAKDKLAALDKFDVDNIISQETWDAINTPFSSSTAYQDAMKYTNELLAQLSSGKTSYTDQIKDMLNQIQNRDKFSYDMSNDTLFQQSLASAMASGKTAMQDTMGQASALTGGYGSTYATSAANQAYNSFIEDAYNNLPEYYEMALKAYEMEGNEMYNQLSALNAADASEYEKMYNSWNSNFQSAQQMYQNEYTAWQDSVNTAIKNAGLQMDEFSTKYDQAYNTYQANQNYADTLYAQEFNKWSAEEDLGLSYAQMAQNQSQYDSDLKYKYDALDQSKSEHESELAYKYDALKQDQKQHDSEMGYKYSALAQSKSESERELAYKYAALEQSKKEHASKLSSKQAENFKKDTAALTETFYSRGLEATLTQLDTLGIEEGSEYGDAIADYMYTLIESDEYIDEDSPLSSRTYTVTGTGFGGKVTQVQDQLGNYYSVDQLPYEVQQSVSKLGKGEKYSPVEAWKKMLDEEYSSSNSKGKNTSIFMVR